MWGQGYRSACCFYAYSGYTYSGYTYSGYTFSGYTFFWLLLLWLLLLWLHLPQGTTPEGLADIRLCIEAFREQLKVFQMVKADARDMAKQLEHLDSFG